jgi:hypothetical protein
MIQTDEVTFIFLGDKLPKYAIASLNLAASTSGMNISIIGNTCIKDSVSHLPVQFVAVEDFYNPEHFSRAASNVWTDHSYRDGFWLKSLERLFVLRQYMKHSGQKSILHAELDQLLFQINVLVSKLDTLKYFGLFVPFHNDKSAVASILYINDVAALDSLLSFACGEIFFPNEMYLIAEWAKINPELIFELPTTATFIHQREDSVIPGVMLLTPNDTGGLVDPAQMGQWVAGIDPKNVVIREKPVNKFVDLPSRFLLTQSELQSIKFSLSVSNELLIAAGDSETKLKLFNLHVHSKIHAIFDSGHMSLLDLFEFANLDSVMAFRGTRLKQIQSFLNFGFSKFIDNPRKSFLFFISKINETLGLRFSSKPFLSSDTFREFSNHVFEVNSKLQPKRIVAGDIIFCDLKSLDKLNSSILIHLKVPIVLIIGNPSTNLDSQFFEKINLPSGSSIYAQNLAEKIPHVFPLPLGLENRWRAKYSAFSPIPKVRKSKNPRINQVVWGFFIGLNPHERSKAAFSLLKTTVALDIRSVRPEEFFQYLSRYGFVACPPGEAIDTHEAWEAMYLGCIPILTDSYLSRYFESQGLPVWVVKSYGDLATFTEDELAIQYDSIHAKTRVGELDLQTWAQRIKTSVGVAKSF